LSAETSTLQLLRRYFEEEEKKSLKERSDLVERVEKLQENRAPLLGLRSGPVPAPLAEFVPKTAPIFLHHHR
jgi:hypothetical protein